MSYVGYRLANLKSRAYVVTIEITSVIPRTFAAAPGLMITAQCNTRTSTPSPFTPKTTGRVAQCFCETAVSEALHVDYLTLTRRMKPRNSTWKRSISSSRPI